MGLGFTCAITLIGIVRELLGNGSLFGMQVMGASFEPMLLMILAPGGFITFGSLLGIINAVTNRAQRRREAAK